MKAKDVMTTEVVTAGPRATVGEIAALMHDRRISGVPIVENGRLAGIVSEGDLLRRRELGTDDRTRSWWLRLLSDDDEAGDYVKTRARYAADVMTKDPVMVSEDTTLGEIAAIFEGRHIKRVPVVRDGALVGIVSRANLVQALAGASGALRADSIVEDAAIRDALLEELEGHRWWQGGTNNVVVAEGVVHYWGFYRDTGEVDAARVAAENTPGVTAIEDHRVPYPAAYGAL